MGLRAPWLVKMLSCSEEKTINKHVSELEERVGTEGEYKKGRCKYLDGLLLLEN